MSDTASIPAATVLIVDDLPQNIGVVYEFLEGEGYEIRVAQSGEQALEIARNEPVDLVLMDVLMPGLGGIEACRRLKAEPWGRDVPVIFLTALAELKDKLEGFRAGGVDYVTKPVQKEELLARVGTHLRLRRLGDELAARNRRLEQEIERERATEQALAESRAWFRAVFDTVSEAIVVLDGDAVVVAVNPAFSRLTGYAPDEALGRRADFLCGEREDPAAHDELWRRLRAAGEWHDERWFLRRSGEPFAVLLSMTAMPGGAGQSERFVAVFRDITERKQAELRLAHQATFDALTDLPNRSLFFDRLGQSLQYARRDGHRVALLFVDLDHFKDINDTLGHAAGDEMLRETARRLRACVRESDTVARLGGDEFAVILPNLEQPDGALRVADKMLEAIAGPVPLGQETRSVSGSIGIALFPDHAESAEGLLARADKAMYEAKRTGRAGRYLFTP